MSFVSFDDVFFNFGGDCDSLPILWGSFFGNIVPINGIIFRDDDVFDAGFV